MIVRLKGIVLEKCPDHMVMDIQGIGYHVWITLNTYESLPEPGEEAILLAYHQIREDSQELFGFAGTEEREIFKYLIAISGVGAKIAVTILSGAMPDELRRKIQDGDESALTAISGIGPKIAKRILVELKDKIGGPASKGGPPPSDNITQAVAGLMGLGYRHQEANRAVKAVKANANTPVEDIVRAALRK